MKNSRGVKKIDLDNTSSVAVVLSGHKSRRKMTGKKPYEVEYKGVTIRCTTPQEAVEVARLLGNAPDNPEYAKWHVDEFTDLVARLQVAQRRLLNVLLKARCQAVRDYDLCGKLGLGSNQALAGVLSGVTKVAKLLEIDPSRIYYQRTDYKQGSPERRYYITAAFMKAADDADWPSPDDLKEPAEDWQERGD